MPRDDSSLEHTDVRAESVVEGSSTGHATMVGSYREPSYATFPKYSSVAISSGVPQIYCRSLLTSGNGFAPSNITGDVRRPEEHFSLGACIGDVGYVDEYGAFVYCFNIFCERNDEMQAMDLPPDFVPFQSSFPTEAVTFSPNYHPPGTIIASEGVHVSRVSESPLHANFTSSMSEGAVLILPSGASREDLVYPPHLYDYVKLNAMRWYQLCNRVNDEKGARVHNVPNGTLRLVTGVDRATSWATATFPYRQIDGYPLSFQYYEDSDPTWINAAGLSTLYRHNKESSMDGNLGAVFLRFMSISVRPTQCTRNSNASSASVAIPRYVLPTVQKPVSRGVFSRFRGPTRISPCPRESIFDPSIILLQVLLRMDTTASVAIVLDSVWRDHLNHKQLSHLELVALMNRILKRNSVVDIDGMATFDSRSSYANLSSTPLWMKLIPCVRSRSKNAPDKSEEAALKEMLKIISR